MGNFGKEGLMNSLLCFVAFDNLFYDMLINTGGGVMVEWGRITTTGTYIQ